MHIYIVGDENEFSKARCRKKQNDDDNYIRLPLSAACWSAGAKKGENQSMNGKKNLNIDAK